MLLQGGYVVLVYFAVAVHIGRIREKLEDDPASPKLLQTVWGIGYKFEVKNQ